ncbi:MAG: hypothetical protein ACYTGL_13865 [Planctomycetota bacterium]
MTALVGPVPPADLQSDNCTLAPDSLPGWLVFRRDRLDLSEACRRHDWSYTVGGDENARYQADRELRVNLLQLGASGLIAGLYYRRVRLFGVRFFNYRWPARAPGFPYRVRLFFTRYLT